MALGPRQDLGGQCLRVDDLLSYLVNQGDPVQEERVDVGGRIDLRHVRSPA